MHEELQAELDVGLSEEEKEDLEQLIKKFRRGEPASSPDASLHDLHEQVQELAGHVVRLSAMVLKFDSRMKSFYDIIRLFYQKSEKMNERINVIIKYLKSKDTP